MAMTRTAWTISGLAVELGRSRRWVAKQLSQHGIAPVGKQGNAKTYYLADVVQAIVEEAAATGAQLAAGDGTYSPNIVQLEQARLTRHKANLAEIEEQEKRGLLAPVDQCVKVVGAMGLILKRRAEAFPDRAAPLVHDARSIPATRKILADIVNELLEELQSIEDEYLEEIGQKAPEAARG